MEDQIRNARLSFTCDQNWEGMKPDGEGRFCSGCQKKVYDLRDKNAAYFIKIMQENNNSVCGRFSRDQMAKPLPYKLKGWKGWLMGMLAVLGLNSCKGEQLPPERLGELEPEVTEPECTLWDVQGIVLPSGYLIEDDLAKLTNHLDTQLKLPSTVHGQLGVTFLLKDGNVEVPMLSGKLDKDLKRKFIVALKSGIKGISKDLDVEFPYQISLVLKNGKIESVLSK